VANPMVERNDTAMVQGQCDPVALADPRSDPTVDAPIPMLCATVSSVDLASAASRIWRKPMDQAVHPRETHLVLGSMQRLECKVELCKPCQIVDAASLLEDVLISDPGERKPEALAQLVLLRSRWLPLRLCSRASCDGPRIASYTGWPAKRG